MEEILQYGAIAISILSLVVSLLAWNKSRVVYEIRTADNRQGEEKINELLKGGDYTVLNIQPDPLNVLRKLYILGKIPNPFKVLGRKVGSYFGH
jgi:hypothetical protein